jgi:glycosyltransferase involved in cell wall biosynthesis
MNYTTPEVSVIVPVSERYDDLQKLYSLYSNELRKIGKKFEFIFVLDQRFVSAFENLKKIQKKNNHTKLVKFSGNFGESAALMEGFQQAKGNTILTLASYIQIEPTDLPKIFAAYDEGNDLVITRRYPRKDPLVNRLQSSLYHFIVKKLTSTNFKDITSGMRLFNKDILPEFNLYGDLHRFIPIFACHKGIKVKEVKVAQRKEDTLVRLVKPGVYLRRGLDILTIFFLVKFTKKPLRFFGLIGTSLSILGFLITGYLAILRLFYGIALSNRPLLILGIMLMVFGIQLFSLGLIGELILFSHAKDIAKYRIEKIFE